MDKTGIQVIIGGDGSQEQVWSLSEMPVGLGSWRQMCLIGVGWLEGAAKDSRGPGDWLQWEPQAVYHSQEGVRRPADGVGERKDRGSGLHINYFNISAKDEVSGSSVGWQVMQLVSSLYDVEPNVTNSGFVSIYIAVNCKLYFTTTRSIKPYFLYIAFAWFQFASELCTGCRLSLDN